MNQNRGQPLPLYTPSQPGPGTYTSSGVLIPPSSPSQPYADLAELHRFWYRFGWNNTGPGTAELRAVFDLPAGKYASAFRVELFHPPTPVDSTGAIGATSQGSPALLAYGVPDWYDVFLYADGVNVPTGSLYAARETFPLGVKTTVTVNRPEWEVARKQMAVQRLGTGGIIQGARPFLSASSPGPTAINYAGPVRFNRIVVSGNFWRNNQADPLIGGDGGFSAFVLPFVTGRAWLAPLNREYEVRVE